MFKGPLPKLVKVCALAGLVLNVGRDLTEMYSRGAVNPAAYVAGGLGAALGGLIVGAFIGVIANAIVVRVRRTS